MKLAFDLTTRTWYVAYYSGDPVIYKGAPLIGFATKAEARAARAIAHRDPFNMDDKSYGATVYGLAIIWGVGACLAFWVLIAFLF